MRTTHIKSNFFQPKAVCFQGTKFFLEYIVRKRRQREVRDWLSQAFLTPIMSNIQNLQSLRKNTGLGVSWISPIIQKQTCVIKSFILLQTLFFICKYRPWYITHSTTSYYWIHSRFIYDISNQYIYINILCMSILIYSIVQ